MSERPVRRRVTQREIAEIAGVSQTTVSMVLNDSAGENVRIPESTRERVRRALEQAKYVADPAARRLAGLDNKIIAVFTYEPALSPPSLDFYGPLLTGIEQAAEQLGCDLLFLTGSPVDDGRRRLTDRRTRYRLADGCLLLGQEMDEAEIESVVDEGFACVSVGRRASQLIPYVGVDYVSATLALVERARDLGHRRLLHVHTGRHTPASDDRLGALGRAESEFGVAVEELIVADGTVPAPVPASALEGVSCVLAEEAFLARRIGLAPDFPDHASLAALGEVAGHTVGGRELTGFHVPRTQMALDALGLLQSVIDDDVAPGRPQRLLSCEVAPGETLRPTTAERG